MKNKPQYYTEGERVHMDTDNADWGRVCGDGTVIETPKPHSGYVLVNSDQVRAGIMVPKRDLGRRDTDNADWGRDSQE